MPQNFVQNTLASFGIGGLPSGQVAGMDGQVAGCCPSPVGEDKLQRLQMRALLEATPQILVAASAATNPVLAGTVGIAVVVPPVAMCLSRIDWPASTAPFFLVTAITVGLCTVIASGGVPAETFIANARNPPIEFSCLAPGTPLTITATNIDANSHRMDVAAWGVYMTGPYGDIANFCCC